jgi:hypothetical protein
VEIMKINSRFKIVCLVALTAAGFYSWVAMAEDQLVKPTFGQGTNTCAGTYYAFAKMTNGSGGVWLTPPVKTTSGVFADLSGFPSPYSSAVIVTRRSDGNPWCGTNGLTFPATNTTSYSITVYVTSQTPPPTNGQPLNLSVTWNTN